MGKIRVIQLREELWSNACKIHEQNKLCAEHEDTHDGNTYDWADGERMRLWTPEKKCFEIGYYNSYEDSEDYAQIDHTGTFHYCFESTKEDNIIDIGKDIDKMNELNELLKKELRKKVNVA